MHLLEYLLQHTIIHIQKSLLFIFLCWNSTSTKSTSLSSILSVSYHLDQLKIITTTRTQSYISFFKLFHPHKEGKYPVLKPNTKFHQLIKHVKVSYSIASLAFYKCSCATYRNSLNRGTSCLRHSSYLKKYQPCQLNTLCRESPLY